MPLGENPMPALCYSQRNACHDSYLPELTLLQNTSPLPRIAQKVRPSCTTQWIERGPQSRRLEYVSHTGYSH